MFLYTPGSNKLLKQLMAANIPQSVKIKVLKEWLQGISRTKISKNNGIVEETVTYIRNSPETTASPILNR
jgi:hypothetical protein